MSNSQNINLFFKEFQNRIIEAETDVRLTVEGILLETTLDNFQNSGFFGEKWVPRKSKKKTHKVLLDTEALRDSIKILRSQPGLVIIGSQSHYASIHNNGGIIQRTARSETFVRNRHKKGKLGEMFGGKGAYAKGTSAGRGMTIKAYSISMPRRQFLGSHPKLIGKLEQGIREVFTSKFK
ncbi:phage virion morphogenesis protein [Sphingobacterium hotanense]|uniref:Phage virion morphogenesis protein n=1 Tax=Sphingobacterium hotanense TaxID=649196 RepID=A0ABT7NLH2_9SPHI|nr:phage virion morphogenesis protein [Sphingobacterium hotanense]MDM1048047.1 phage virion morphogenesis protein [Sphingobacterium hotanense]